MFLASIDIVSSYDLGGVSWNPQSMWFILSWKILNACLAFLCALVGTIFEAKILGTSVLMWFSKNCVLWQEIYNDYFKI